MFDNMSTIILSPIHRIFVHLSLFWHRVSFFLWGKIRHVYPSKSFLSPISLIACNSKWSSPVSSSTDWKIFRVHCEKKPDKMKKHKKKFANQPTGNFFSNFIVKEGCSIGYWWRSRTRLKFWILFWRTLLPESLTEWSELF